MRIGDAQLIDAVALKPNEAELHEARDVACELLSGLLLAGIFGAP